MKTIYLDYQATTPLAPEARAAMLPWLGAVEGPESDKLGYANPHSAHAPGRAAAAAVEAARAAVAAPFPSDGRLVFTGGATEALNLAIIGAIAHDGPGRRIVTIATEHAAVLDTVGWLEAQGVPVTVLPVRRDGLIDLAAARAAIGPDVALVAAMLVNNEIGVIQPVDALCALAHEAGALFLCDAVQGYGRVDLPEDADLIAITAHKIHGPKGIGALWVRDGTPLRAVQHGGGQEHGLRSGTLSPALCAGFGAAASLAFQRRASDLAHAETLWDHMQGLLSHWTLNGAVRPRYCGNLNLRRPGLDVGRLMSEARGVAFSAGSACASGSGRPSHVLTAIGLTREDARSSIRLGFGRYTTLDEITEAAHRIEHAAQQQLG